MAQVARIFMLTYLIHTSGDDIPEIFINSAKLAAEFSRGREFWKDPWFRHPPVATTEEIIKRVQHMVTDDSLLILRRVVTVMKEWRIFCIINIAWQRFLLGECHIFWHLIKREPGWSHYGNIWHWSRSSKFSCKFSNLGFLLALSLLIRNRGNPCNGNTPPATEKARSLHLQGT